MDAIELLGLIAGALTTSAFIPQVIKIYKTKSAKDISLGMYLVFVGGVTLWLIYGVAIGKTPMIIWNGVGLFFAIVVIVMKLKYK